MAESYQERRKRELGITESYGPSIPNTQEAANDGISFQQRRMMDLGMVPDTRPKFEQAQPTVVQPVSSEPTGELLPYNPSIWQQIKDVAQSTFGDNGEIHNDIRAGANRFASGLVSPLVPLVNRAMGDDKGNAAEQVRQQDLQYIPAGAAKGLEIGGELTGMLLPVEAAYATGGKLAAKGLAKLAPNAPKLLQSAARGVGAGLAYGTAKETLGALTEPDPQLSDLITGDIDKRKTLGDRLANVGVDALTFGLGDGAFSLLGKGLKAGAGAIKNGWQSLSDQTPELGASLMKRIGQKTRVPENPESVNDLIDVGGRQTDPNKGSLFSRFYTNIVDEQAPIQRAVNEMSDGKLETADDPSKIAWLSRGWKGKADTKLQYGIMDEAGNKVGQSLEEVLHPVKTRLNDLREYAAALRSLEYDSAGLQSGIPRELAESTIFKYAEDSQLKSAYEGLRQYITDMNKDTLVDSGIWSPEKLMQLRREQPNYIPMFRVQEKGIRDGMQQASGKGFGNVKDPTKARTGSAKPIVDPIESIIKQTYKNQALAERNNVMRSLVELAEKSPDSGIMQRVESGSAANEIMRSLDDLIANPSDNMDSQLREALDLFRPQTVNGKKNVVTVMRNGKPEQWQINDDQLATVIAGLGSEPTNPLVNMVGKATGWLKAGLVLAPDFVVKNLVRDQMSAFVNSKYGFVPLVDTFSGLFSAVKKDSAFWKWMNSGGANGSWVSLERDYLQGQIREITKRNIASMGNPIEIMRKLSELSEQATRIGEFKRGLKKGASLQDAALASRDVTLDFSRIGAKSKSMNKLVAFFNVAVQSIDKLARQFKERPAQTALKTTLSITLPSVVLYLMNSQRPEYNELPQWERDTNWHVYVPGMKDPIRIPKPFELGITAGTFAERLLRALKDHDPKAFDEYTKQVISGFAPSVIPTFVTPWFEAWANKDFFTGAPIVPKREEKLLPKDQFGPYTSETAKRVGSLISGATDLIGAKVDLSPRVIENTITGYTGTLGRYGLQTLDGISNALTGKKTPEKPDAGLADMPIARSFVSKGLEGSSQSLEDFYKEKERLTQERGSAKKDKVKFPDERKYDRYNNISEQISNKQGKIRAIQADMNMSGKEKSERIRQLNIEIVNLARKAKGSELISLSN